MQSKKEAIEILKAKIENAINCNTNYHVVIYSLDGNSLIRIIDQFGYEDLKYDETKKSAVKGTDYIRTKESYTAEIAANTRDAVNYLKDMRAMLTDHSIKQVFMESQCDHYLGLKNEGYGLDLIKQSKHSDKPDFWFNLKFAHCPNCGSKLR